jgi:hypothetical protein
MVAADRVEFPGCRARVEAGERCGLPALLEEAGRVLPSRRAERAPDCLDVDVDLAAFRVVALVPAPPLDVFLAARDPGEAAVLAVRGARGEDARELDRWAPLALARFSPDRVDAGFRLVDLLLDVVKR